MKNEENSFLFSKIKKQGKIMEDYIKYIRSLVGHKKIMAVGVAILIVNEKGEILLETRSDNGCFSFPGGALNMGEKVKSGAIRETYEETGIKLKEEDLKLIGIYSGEEGRLEYPNKDITYYTDIIFFASVDSKTIEIKPLDNESKEIKFYPFNEIDLNRCLKMDRKVLVNYSLNGIKEIVID